MRDALKRYGPWGLLAVFGVLLGVVLILAITGDEDSGSKARVTVTVPPLVSLVSQVAGPDVVVEALVAAGETPETFQPTDLDITGVARSAVFFRVGVPAENGPWLSSLEEMGSTRIVDLRQGVELREMEGGHGPSPEPGGEGSSKTMDPHIWLSPRRLEIMTGTVARSLAEVDPGRASEYQERAAALRDQLRDLDQELQDLLAPVKGRAFLVFHPAWGYFADDYGLRQVAVEIEGKEPSETELTELVRQARALQLETLFVQPQISSATPAPLGQALGARLETLDPLAPDLLANLRQAGEKILEATLPAAEPQ